MASGIIRKERNNSIDIFRYVCAIMIVAIHTQPFMNVNLELGYIFTQIIPRIGVPYFFAVSGYFYFQHLMKGEKTRYYLKRILRIYITWSILYFLIDFIQWGQVNLKDFIFSCVSRLFVEGSYYHFWFFPAVIYACCLSTIIYRVLGSKILILSSILLYIIGCLGCSYFAVGVKIPVLGNLFISSHFTPIRRILMMGFPFFVSGYLINMIENKIELNRSIIWRLWGISIVLWILEIVFVIKYNLQNNIIITPGLYLMLVCTLLVLLKNPFPKYTVMARKMKKMANITYYVHPLCILSLNYIATNILNMKLNETNCFILTIITTLIIGLILIKLNIDDSFVLRKNRIK